MNRASEIHQTTNTGWSNENYHLNISLILGDVDKNCSVCRGDYSMTVIISLQLQEFRRF